MKEHENYEAQNTVPEIEFLLNKYANIYLIRTIVKAAQRVFFDPQDGGDMFPLNVG
jgi:hypothetical protein